MRNWRAFWALIVALVAIGALVGAAAAAELRPEISYLQAAAAIPVTVFLAFFSLSLARRARAAYQRTLGRVGGNGLARFARGLAVLALLLATTAALALGVFALLAYTD